MASITMFLFFSRTKFLKSANLTQFFFQFLYLLMFMKIAKLFHITHHRAITKNLVYLRFDFFFSPKNSKKCPFHQFVYTFPAKIFRKSANLFPFLCSYCSSKIQPICTHWRLVFLPLEIINGLTFYFDHELALAVFVWKFLFSYL